MRLRLLVLSAALAVLPMSLRADTVTLNATGTGWCGEELSCNTADFNSLANYIASPDYAGYGPINDWFGFDLSGITQTITSATFTAYNPFSIITGSEVYAINGTGSFDYSGLVSGSSFGTVTVTQADEGEDVSVTFNAAGIAALNAGLGSGFVFGGQLESSILDDQIFGDTQGTFGADVVQLDLTTSDTSAVPEPSSLVLIGTGLVGVFGAVRRRVVVQRDLTA